MTSNSATPACSANTRHSASAEGFVKTELDMGELHEMCGGTVAIVVATPIGPDDGFVDSAGISDALDANRRINVAGSAAAPGAAPGFASTGEEEGAAEIAFDSNPLRNVDGAAALNEVIAAACWAQTAALFVIVPPELTDAASRIVHSVKRKSNGPDPQLIEMDFAATRAQMPSEREPVAGVEGYVLDVAEMLAANTPGGYDSLLVLTADTPEIRGTDIYNMCAELCKGEEAIVRFPCAPSCRQPVLIADSELSR